MTGAERAGSLDPDLVALVGRLGVPLRAAGELTTLPSPVFDRPAWRLELADGRVLKGRVFADAAEAARFAELAAVLPKPGFPLRAQLGRARARSRVSRCRRPGPRCRRCGELLDACRQKLSPDAQARLVGRERRSRSVRCSISSPTGVLERRECDALAALAQRAFPSAASAESSTWISAPRTWWWRRAARPAPWTTQPCA